MKKTTLLLSLFVLGTYAIPTTVNAQTAHTHTQTTGVKKSTTTSSVETTPVSSTVDTTKESSEETIQKTGDSETLAIVMMGIIAALLAGGLALIKSKE